VNGTLNKQSFLSGAFDFQQSFEMVLYAAGPYVVARTDLSLTVQCNPAGAFIVDMADDVLFSRVSGPTIELFEIVQNNDWLFSSKEGFPVTPNGGTIIVLKTGSLFQLQPPGFAVAPPLPLNGHTFHIDWDKQAKKFGDYTGKSMTDNLKKLEKKLACAGCYGTGFHKGFGGPCRAAGCTAGRR
jgi:hypothetical protein